MSTTAVDDDPLLPREPPPDLSGVALNRWALAERNRQRRAYVIHETRWLLDGGVRPDLVASRVGYAHIGSLTAALDRWGEHDLAKRFRVTAWDGMTADRVNAANRRRHRW